MKHKPVLFACASFLLLFCASSCSGEQAQFEGYIAQESGSHQNPGDIWDGTYNAAWYDGKQKTYTLDAPDQLAGLSYLVNVGKVTFEKVTITLSEDIYLNETSAYSFHANRVLARTWIPIGLYASPKFGSRPFKGTFDGNNHTIYGMKIDDVLYASTSFDSDSLGLFGYADFPRSNAPSLLNLSVQKSYIETSGKVGLVAGGILGTALGGGGYQHRGGLRNLASGVDFFFEKALTYVGGIVGRCNVNILQCCSTGQIDASRQRDGFGGIAGGGGFPFYIVNCYTTMDGSWLNGFRFKGSGIITSAGIPYYCLYQRTPDLNDRVFSVGKSRRIDSDATHYPQGNGRFPSLSGSPMLIETEALVADDAFYACHNRRDCDHPEYYKANSLLDRLNLLSLDETFGAKKEAYSTTWQMRGSDNNGYPIPFGAINNG